MTVAPMIAAAKRTLGSLKARCQTAEDRIGGGVTTKKLAVKPMAITSSKAVMTRSNKR